MYSLLNFSSVSQLPVQRYTLSACDIRGRKYGSDLTEMVTYTVRSDRHRQQHIYTHTHAHTHSVSHPLISVFTLKPNYVLKSKED